MGRHVWLVVLLLAGCGGGKTEIDITLHAEDAVTDLMLASVRTLHVEAGEPDVYSGDVPLAGHVLQRTEKLVYKPRVDAGAIALTLSAVDDNGALVACTAPAAIQLSPGLGAPLTMTLHPCSGIPDFAVPNDLPAADLSGPDLLVPDGGILCPTDAVLCDDFEGGTLAKWTSDPTATVDTTRAYHGTHSARVHVTGSDASAYSQTLFGLNADSQFPLYVRAYIYVPGTDTGKGGDLIFVGTQLNAGVVIFGYGNGHWGIGSQNLGTGEAAGQADSTIAVPGDVWTCVEWRVDPVAPGNTGGLERVAFGTVDDPSLHIDGVQLTAPNQVLFGWAGLLGSTQSVDVWFDDIAIAHTPMGCP